jgi:hypothetical protein
LYELKNSDQVGMKSFNIFLGWVILHNLGKVWFFEFLYWAIWRNYQDGHVHRINMLTRTLTKVILYFYDISTNSFKFCKFGGILESFNE